MLFHYILCWVIFLSCEHFTRFSIGGSLPQKTSASFYELANKEGYKISYRDGPLGWTNLQRLFSKNGKNAPPELLCVSGIWLVYPNPGYKTAEEDTVNLISGKDKCLNPSELEKVGAMQPLTSLTVTSDSSITLFTNSNFGSVAHSFTESQSEKGGIKQLEEDADIGSLVIIGEKPWSLLSSNGKMMCVRPQSSGQGPSICYSINLAQVQDFHVNAVFPDCPDEKDPSILANVKLTDCKEFGSEKAEPLKTIGMMGRSFGSTLECGYNITWDSTKFTEEESALIAKLLTIRLTHDFEITEQILWPDAREDIWRTGPLDCAFDIMIATVPDDIVNVHFLAMAREFAVYHLNEVWKQQRENGEKMGSLKSWRSHRVLVHLLSKCFLKATKAKDRFSEIIKSSYSIRRTLSDFNNEIDSDLLLNPKYDPIIEIAWVVSNYAMALCHNLFEYRVNFWDNFITTFEHLYFRPLQNRWKNPTIISPKTFGVIMSGFGIEIQHRRIAFATTKMLELTPKLAPFGKDPRTYLKS